MDQKIPAGFGGASFAGADGQCIGYLSYLVAHIVPGGLTSPKVVTVKTDTAPSIFGC